VGIMDSLNIVSCGFLKSTSGYSVSGIITMGFLDELGEPGEVVLDIFEVLKVRKNIVKMADQKDLDLRERAFRI
jgi:hypothetical protein